MTLHAGKGAQVVRTKLVSKDANLSWLMLFCKREAVAVRNAEKRA